MTLLIQEYQKKMLELDTKIEALNTQLTKFKAHTRHDQLEKQLRERFEKYNKRYLLKKTKNYFGTKRSSRKNAHIDGLIVIEHQIPAIHMFVLLIAPTIEPRYPKYLNHPLCLNLHLHSQMHIDVRNAAAWLISRTTTFLT